MKITNHKCALAWCLWGKCTVSACKQLIITARPLTLLCHPCQYFEWSCSTLQNSIWSGLTLLSSMENPFLVISAVKTPRQPVPARCQSSGEWLKETKRIHFDYWDMIDTKTKSSYSAFVFNFPQVFIHTIWHLSQRGLLWCEWDGKCTLLYLRCVNNSVLWLHACVHTWLLAHVYCMCI